MLFGYQNLLVGLVVAQPETRHGDPKLRHIDSGYACAKPPKPSYQLATFNTALPRTN